MPYRLRDLREDADLFQKDMAEKMFMHPNQYRRYESGESDIPLALAIRFASFFHVSLDYFAGLVPSPSSPADPPSALPETVSEVVVLSGGQQTRKKLDDRQMKLLLAYLQLL